MTSQRATELSKDNYVKVIAKSRKMDELIERHSNIMAKYDPEHKIKLVVDEWGTWYKTEEGTNPRFLHQQSTMTDAIVAAGTLDIFNSRCNIVSMANIAQTVNVLQAVILTSGKQLIKTPTYHVFDIYKEHQNNMLLESYCENKRLDSDEQVNAISHSASMKEDGSVFITLSNACLDKEYEMDMELFGNNYENAEVSILASDNYLSHNSFDDPENLKKEKYSKYKLNLNRLTVKLPPCCVVGMSLK
jgi:alpha-N-arabinofuranosidase